MIKKRFLPAAVSVLALGSASLWLWSWYSEQSPIATRPAEEELFEAGRRAHGDLAIPVNEPAIITASQSVRLAIGNLGFEDETKSQQVADLVLAELAATKGLQFVERQNLESALREMELSLSNLARTKDIIQLGKLLKADWFLLGRVTTTDGHDSLTVRVVDVRTGVIRNVGAVSLRPDLSETANELAAFLRRSRETAAKPIPPVFLAIGPFADVGINDRHSAFSKQLKSYLATKFQTSSVTVLEREQVNALLQEVRLDLAGLSSENKSQPMPLQSAFWLVEGFFQSQETKGFEVEAAVRINRMFGKSETHNFRGRPDESLFEQVYQSINSTLSKQSLNLLTPTRRNEIVAQMQLAKDFMRHSGAWEELVFFSNRYPPQKEINEQRRRYFLRKAIQALETAILLNSTNAEAKVYLGFCLQDWSLRQIEESRQQFREAATILGTDKWPATACYALGRSYYYENKHEAARWFRMAAELAESPSQKIRYEKAADDALTDALSNDAAETGTIDPKALKLAETKLFEAAASANEVLHGRSGGISDQLGFEHYVDAFGTNSSAAANSVTELLPSLQAKFPEMAPHLLAAAVATQVETNGALIVEFKKSLAEISKQPDKVLMCDSYFESVTRTVYGWCIDRKIYSLAVELLETKRKAATKASNLTFDQRDNVRLGFAHLKLEQWTNALAAFQAAGEAAIKMESDGPWGGAFKPFLPGKAADTIRQKLGLSSAQSPHQITFESKCCLHTPSTFTIEDERLWIATSAHLLETGFNLKTNAQISLPIPKETPLTVIETGPNNIWIGTQGKGLIDYDKINQTCRRLTQSDGLLLDDITALHFSGDTLWIGFGRADIGGFGKLDLKSNKLSAFTPVLPVDPLQKSDSLEGPPRIPLTTINPGRPDEIWMKSTKSSSLRRYHFRKDHWDSLPSQNGVYIFCFNSDDKRIIAGLSLMQISVQFKNEQISGDTNASAEKSVVMTQLEWNRLQTDQVFRGKVKGTSIGREPHKGAIGVRNFNENEWELMADDGSLPTPPKTLTVDGSAVWLGGEGYIAAFNLSKKKVSTIGRIEARSVEKIETGGGYVWAQFDRHLHRALISSTE